MKSQRKKRSRSAEAPGGQKPSATKDSEGKSAPPSPVAQPPKRNITMLSVSVIAFVIWILFLVYVALFG